MALLSSIHRPRQYERGGVSWVTLVLLAAIAGAVYLFIAWMPIYVVHYEVKQTVRDYMNQAVKNRDDAALIEKLCQKLRSLDTSEVVGADGRIEKVPSVNVTADQVTWERDMAATPPMLHVTFEYTRQVHYPYAEKVSEWVGTVDLDNDLTIPDWGPSR
ncbi:MAG: hypothetical protein WCC48_07100 [Anaeromyxobacteraceae bacterium]